MTREEALIAMIKGNKVSRRGMEKGVYIEFRRSPYRFIFHDSCGKEEPASGCFMQDDGYEIYKEPKIITIDGKDIEISEESFEALKKQLLE